MHFLEPIKKGFGHGASLFAGAVIWDNLFDNNPRRGRGEKFLDGEDNRFLVAAPIALMAAKPVFIVEAPVSILRIFCAGVGTTFINFNFWYLILKCYTATR
jgi:hypothetical protein